MTDQQREVRYSADSQLRRPRQFLAATWRGLKASRSVSRRLMLRDLRSGARQSALGYLWLFAPSVAMAAVWVYLDSGDIVNTGSTPVPYPVYVLAGTLLWQSLSESVLVPIQQLNGAAPMLNKVNFPPESVLIAGLLRVVVNSGIRLCVLVPALIYWQVAPSASVILAPLGVFAIILFGFAIGVTVAPIGVLYRDIPQGLTIALTFWFLITPVAYQVPSGGIARRLALLNPATWLIETARDWLTGGPALPPTGWWVIVVASTALLVIGWLFFRLSVPHLIDRIST